MGKLYRVPPSTRRRRPLNRRQVTQVRKIVNSGKQFKTKATYGQQTITSTGALTELTAITEGDDFYNREGDKIQLLNIKMLLSMINNSTTPTTNKARIMIVRAKGAPLVVADMPTFESQPDLDKMSVLWEEHWFFDDQVTYQPIQRNSKIRFKKGRIPYMLVKYDDDESATNAQHNAVYAYWVGSEATNGPMVRYIFYTNYWNAT